MAKELTFPGMRIGLLGGSFNPAHEGHRHISLIALRRLGLDQVWWLVSPQNPLKSPKETANYDARLKRAAEVAAHPRIRISDFERRHSLQFTYETLKLLHKRRPEVNFVWLMGADNLVGFHKWQHWREIAKLLPVAVFARPGSRLQAPLSFAGRFLSGDRLDQQDSVLLAGCKPPAWVYLTESSHPASSTLIRKNRDWPPKV